MRNLSDLYVILLEEFKDCKRDTGICSRIDSLLCNEKYSTKEWTAIKNHMERNKPQIFSKFFWHPSYNWAWRGGFWWLRTRQGYEQRVKFLESMIVQTLKKENEVH